MTDETKTNAAQTGETLLSARGIVKHYRLRGAEVRAVNDVSVHIAAGEVLCVVGESGCGKTTLARVIAGLLRPTAGEVYYRGKRIDALSGRDRLPICRAMQMIFQNPYESLNPRMTVLQTLREALRFHFPETSGEERRTRMEKALADTGLSADALSRYPHQFSGGQRQRISIARALIVRPQCLIADEPVAALDLSVQAQILNLLTDLRETRRLAYLFITHDLSVVENFGDRAAVMYLGAVCETAPCRLLFSRPRHPYTRILLEASPKIGKPLRPPSLPGEPPSPMSLPSGCVFHPRCPHANRRCQTEPPRLRQESPQVQIACHAVEEGRI